MYNLCFRSSSTSATQSVSNSAGTAPADTYWSTHYMSGSYSTGSFCGLTLSTGSTASV